MFRFVSFPLFFVQNVVNMTANLVKSARCLRRPQNELCDLARVRIRVRVRFTSEICKLRKL